MSLISLDNVGKSFKNQVVINQLNLTIYQGELMLLIGKNGSGKSTLLKLIAGIIPLTNGNIIRQFVRHSYLPEKIEMPLFINAFDYIKTIHEINQTMMDSRLIERLNLNLEKGIHQLSKGNQKRIMVYLCFSHQAELILLDEPFDGLDDETQDELILLIKEYQKKGITFIVSTHEPEKFKDSQVRVIHFDAMG